MRYHVTLDERTFVVALGPDGVRVDDEPVTAELRPAGGRGVYGFLLDGRSHRVLSRRDGPETWTVHLDGAPARARVVDERTRVIREMTATPEEARGPRPVLAPMPGLVVKVEVAEGDLVVEGQGLVIVEAMKMENELRALGPARVTRVHVTAGQPVEKGQSLIDFGPVDAEEASG